LWRSNCRCSIVTNMMPQLNIYAPAKYDKYHAVDLHTAHHPRANFRMMHMPASLSKASADSASHADTQTLLTLQGCRTSPFRDATDVIPATPTVEGNMCLVAS
jgi:hypothetical protein